MKRVAGHAWFRHATMAGMVLLVWLVGFLAMQLPAFDGLRRLSYDCLHVFANHRPDPRVLIVAMNEDTDRKLGRHQGEPFSRLDHARLLDRLNQAGAERVCFDILFDLPSVDPQVDEKFAKAISANGHVILGAAEETIRRQGNIHQKVVVMPAPALRTVAEGWGLLNVAAADSDGVVRRFDTRTELAPALALVAARAEKPELKDDTTRGSWLHYPTLPGEMPTMEFADCLDPQTVPDEVLRGKTIFVGGQYATDEYGRRDVFATPYTRFGEPNISGVAWHATAFLNARDQLWFTLSGIVRDGIWCLPFAIGAVLGLGKKWTWRVISAWVLLAIVLAVAAVFLIWNSRILVNWMVPLLVQFPLCLLALLVHKMAVPRVRWLAAPQPREIENIEVFISFSSKDEALASRLRQMLDDNGHPAWLCLHHISAGSLWTEAIAQAIERCKLVLFVMSKHSLASIYCLNELTLAFDDKKPILPVRLDNTPLPQGFKLLHGSTQDVNACSKSLPECFPDILAAMSRMSTESLGH